VGFVARLADNRLVGLPFLEGKVGPLGIVDGVSLAPPFGDEARRQLPTTHDATAKDCASASSNGPTPGVLLLLGGQRKVSRSHLSCQSYDHCAAEYRHLRLTAFNQELRRGDCAGGVISAAVRATPPGHLTKEQLSH
jgi:hypothetical protein